MDELQDDPSSDKESLPDDHNTVRIKGAELTFSNRDNEKCSIPIDNVIAIIPKPDPPGFHYSVLYSAPNPYISSGTGAYDNRFKYHKIHRPANDVRCRLDSAEDCDWLRPLGIPRREPERLVIVSTGSGTGLAQSAWENLVDPLLDYVGLTRDRDFRVVFTESETSVAEFTTDIILPRANEGLHQSILLLSGDGGIVDLVNSLLAGQRSDKYRKPIISLLPLGTGNALANSSGIAGDKTLGLSTVFRGTAKTLPLFRATFSPGARLLTNHGQDSRPLDGVFEGHPAAYGAVVCSWGLHATLVADSDTPEYRKFGAERFKMAAKEALNPSDGSTHAYQGSFEMNQPGKDPTKLLRRDHGYILVTPVSQLEAGFTISPASRPLDGKLRLVEFGHLSGEEAMPIMGKAYQGGKHVEDDRVGYHEVKSVKINIREEDARWRRVCLDGKIIQVEQDGWVEVAGPVEGVVDLVVNLEGPSIDALGG